MWAQNEVSSAALAATALELAKTASWHARIDQPDYLYLSPAAQTLLGLPPALEDRYAVTTDILPCLRSNDQESFVTALAQLWQQVQSFDQHASGDIPPDASPHTDQWDLRFRFKRPSDEDYIQLRIAAKAIPVQTEDGRYILGAFQDVSEQSRIERELRDSQEKFELATLGSGDGLWVYDHKTKITWFSPRFVELLGYAPDEFPATFDAWRERYHPDDSPRAFGAFEAHLRTDKIFDQEYRVRHRDGHYLWFRARARSMRDGRGRPYITAGTVSDLTPLKNAQAQLVQSEKMASLGTLVAGVAHEMNTPMGVALTIASQLIQDRDQLAENYKSKTMTREMLDRYMEQAGEGLGIILKNLTVAANLVRSFKQVSADQASEEPRRVNLGGYIEDILRNVHPVIRRAGIEVALDLDDDIEVELLTGALSQVITNLVQNAAMHAFENVSEPRLMISCRREGAQVLIRCQDNGRGMTDEVRQKAFDPFFTTKRNSGGTGLGLHIVHNLITGPLKGTLKLTTAPGQGTEFLISIPA